MKKISRILVVLFVRLILQSSLGTKADLVEAKNLGQNGYKKYSDGFIIQWGYSNIGGSGKYIYLPTSFYDTNYSVALTSKSTAAFGVISVMINAITSTSYFKTESRYNDANTVVVATDGFYWIAIGRWK